MPSSISSKITDIIKHYNYWDKEFWNVENRGERKTIEKLLIPLRKSWLDFHKLNPQHTKYQEEQYKEKFEGIASHETIRKDIMEKDHTKTDEELKKNTKEPSLPTVVSKNQNQNEKNTTDIEDERKEKRKLIHQTKRDVII